MCTPVSCARCSAICCCLGCFSVVAVSDPSIAGVTRPWAVKASMLVPTIFEALAADNVALEAVVVCSTVSDVLPVSVSRGLTCSGLWMT